MPDDSGVQNATFSVPVKQGGISRIIHGKSVSGLLSRCFPRPFRLPHALERDFQESQTVSFHYVVFSILFQLPLVYTLVLNVYLSDSLTEIPSIVLACICGVLSVALALVSVITIFAVRKSPFLSQVVLICDAIVFAALALTQALFHSRNVSLLFGTLVAFFVSIPSLPIVATVIIWTVSISALILGEVINGEDRFFIICDALEGFLLGVGAVVYVVVVQGLTRVIFLRKKDLVRRVFEQRSDMMRSGQLLRGMLPPHVVDTILALDVDVVDGGGKEKEGGRRTNSTTAATTSGEEGEDVRTSSVLTTTMTSTGGGGGGLGGSIHHHLPRLSLTTSKLLCESYDDATVVFVKINQFEKVETMLGPKELITLLDRIYTLFDATLASVNSMVSIKNAPLYRIKVVSQKYVFAAGLPNRCPGGENEYKHPELALLAAIRILREMRRRKEFAFAFSVGGAGAGGVEVEPAESDRRRHHHRIGISIGMDVGPVLAGVVNVNLPAYDVWSDVVNVASKLADDSEANSNSRHHHRPSLLEEDDDESMDVSVVDSSASASCIHATERVIRRVRGKFRFADARTHRKPMKGGVGGRARKVKCVYFTDATWLGEEEEEGIEEGDDDGSIIAIESEEDSDVDGGELSVSDLVDGVNIHDDAVLVVEEGEGEEQEEEEGEQQLNGSFALESEEEEREEGEKKAGTSLTSSQRVTLTPTFVRPLRRKKQRQRPAPREFLNKKQQTLLLPSRKKSSVFASASASAAAEEQKDEENRENSSIVINHHDGTSSSFPVVASSSSVIGRRRGREGREEREEEQEDVELANIVAKSFVNLRSLHERELERGFTWKLLWKAIFLPLCVFRERSLSKIFNRQLPIRAACTNRILYGLMLAFVLVLFGFDAMRKAIFEQTSIAILASPYEYWVTALLRILGCGVGPFIAWIVLLTPLYTLHSVGFHVLNAIAFLLILIPISVVNGFIGDGTESGPTSFLMIVLLVLSLRGVPVFVSVVELLLTLAAYLAVQNVRYFGLPEVYLTQLNMVLVFVVSVPLLVVLGLKEMEEFIFRGELQSRLNRLVRVAKGQERLLATLLPRNVLSSILDDDASSPRDQHVIACVHNGVSVLCCDIYGFTSFAHDKAPSEVLLTLKSYFDVFDRMAMDHHLCRLKFVGDAVVMCSRVEPSAHSSSCTDVALCALALIEYVQKERFLTFRIGIHLGDVLAGVICCQSRPQYDLFGATMHIVEEFEQTSIEKSIHCSHEFASALPHGEMKNRYHFVRRNLRVTICDIEVNSFWLRPGPERKNKRGRRRRAYVTPVATSRALRSTVAFEGPQMSAVPRFEYGL